MTFEELESLVTDLEKKVKDLHDLDFKNITEFDQLPALDFGDSLIAVTTTDYTGKVTIEQIMEYLNKNLKNFICWKPYVENDTLKWTRSSSDESPNEIKFADIIFPMASETDNGMLSSADFIKLSKINENKIVYSDTLTEILKKYSLTSHTHEQYQLKSQMPTKLSEFNNDTKYITAASIPKNISAFTNDKKYLVIGDIPNVSSTKSGFMTPEILKILSDLVDTSVSHDDLDKTIKNLKDNLPTRVSEFVNDANYVPANRLYNVFGELGAVNIIRNSEFRYLFQNAVADWTIDNGTLERFTDDADIEYCGKIAFSSTTVLGALFDVSSGTNNTVSFLAKADSSSTFEIHIGDGKAEVTIGTTWRKYSVNISDGGTNPSMYMTFNLKDSADTTLYLTEVKVEKGSLMSEYMPSYSDLQKLAKVPATTSEYGAVLPDGETLLINEYGQLQVAPSAINDIRIVDAVPTKTTVYSSSHIEEMLATYAPLEEGKVPAEYLPEYLDDVLEGTMSIDSDGNYVFTVAAGQYGPSEPSKGIIYLDTESNTAWRWTGSTYTQCTTDKLGGAVMVKYNAADKYMYFVFPE